MKSTIILFVFTMILFLNGCGGSSAPNPQTNSYQYQQPASSLCDVNATYTDGFLCAIKPSRLDAKARDIYGSSTVNDSTFGFGYHVIAFPKNGTTVKGIYVHLTGSYGRPYNQDTTSLGNEVFLKESFNSGYIMIQLAYNNRFAVNSADECGGANTGVNNCAGDVRREKITGSNVSSINVTPLSDSIEHRLKLLVQYFEAQGFIFPVNIVINGNIDWSRIRVGGHSQGAGHSLYIVKYLKGKHGCMLSGAYDTYDTDPVIPGDSIADWFLDNSVVIDKTKLKGLLSVDDSNYSYFTSAYGVLNLIENTHWKTINAAPYSDKNGDSLTGHAAPLKDPRFATQRYMACFY